MNTQRFILFLEEFYICKVKNCFHFVGKEDEYIYLLDNGTEISVKPYSDREEL